MFIAIICMIIQFQSIGNQNDKRNHSINSENASATIIGPPAPSSSSQPERDTKPETNPEQPANKPPVQPGKQTGKDSKGTKQSDKPDRNDQGNDSSETHAGKDQTHQKVAYLTFDDGPSANADKIMDILDQFDAKATFFMLEPNMRKHPDALKRMNKDGHALAMHGVTHSVKKFYESKESVLGEMDQGRDTVKEIAGVESKLIRTPYGSKPNMKSEYLKAVEDAGYLLWDWNIDSLDWKYKDKRMVDEVKKAVPSLEKRGQAPIILLHDRKQTAQYLEEILTYLQDRGYTFEPLDETMEPFTFKSRH